MNAAGLQWLIDRDLAHIPVGAHRSGQRLLREVYQEVRRADLEEDLLAPPRVAMAVAVAVVRQSHEGEYLDYDRAYFGEHG